MKLFRNLKAKLIHLLLQWALRQAVKLSLQAIKQFPWYDYGRKLNALTDARFSAIRADEIQVALGEGCEYFAKGLKEQT